MALALRCSNWLCRQSRSIARDTATCFHALEIHLLLLSNHPTWLILPTFLKGFWGDWVTVLAFYSPSDFLLTGINTNNSWYILKMVLPCTISQNLICRIHTISWYQLCLQPCLARRGLLVATCLEEREGSSGTTGWLWDLDWELQGFMCVMAEWLFGFFFFSPFVFWRW